MLFMVCDWPLATGGATAVEAELGGAGRDRPEAEGEGNPDTFYDAMKQAAADRAARTRAALDALPPAQRIALEGHTPGTYLRLLLSGATSCVYSLLKSCSSCGDADRTLGL